MSQAAEDKALKVYWQVVGVAQQLKANGLDAGVWEKAASLLEKDAAVSTAREREVERRNEKIAYHQAQMRPEVLAQTNALDRVSQLEAENAALRAKAIRK